MSQINELNTKMKILIQKEKVPQEALDSVEWIYNALKARRAQCRN